MWKPIVQFGLAVLLFASCSNGDQGRLVSKSSQPNSEVQQTEAPTPSNELPSGHPPIASGQNPSGSAMPGSSMPMMAPQGSGGEVKVDGNMATTAGLKFQIDPSWTSETPASSMRAAQFKLPSDAGDSQSGSLVLFRGIGGGAQANITRWINQFSPESASSAKQETIQNPPFTIHYLEIYGTFSASMGPMAPATKKEDQGMLAGVVEGPGGPWHWKATGPEATIKKWKPAFMAMLKSTKPGQ